MRSLLMRSIYAGLGLLGNGAETVEQLGRKFAKKAAISEKDGEKIARQLVARSEKAMKAVQKTLNDEAALVVQAVRAATRELSGSPSGRSGPKRPKRKASSTR